LLLIKLLNKSNSNFRLCYISSESAEKGSFDDVYAVAKAATERFIREFVLKNPESRIFGVQPMTILSDMTLNRTDFDRLREYQKNTRKGFVDPSILADCIINLFSEEWKYFSNEIVKINDGKFARRRY
jgi:NAD(P)-dependent dehydrogenase (short-subunit alcohol dehydrogenase family)